MSIDGGLTLAIAGLAVGGVVIRPARLPEAVWAVLGALIVVASGLMPWRAALAAAGRGTDVYLFLTGMMLLSETARREGLFDWLATEAVILARGSPRRLFLLVYAVGTAVTVFMSNDATAVVLTPAVAAAARAAKLAPLPFLFACAFVANAASFVLPISNPANLVLYGGQMPGLAVWLTHFAAPSAAAILTTYLVLRWRLGRDLAGAARVLPEQAPLPRGAGVAFAGIVITAAVLMIASALHLRLGLPAAAAGAATALASVLCERNSPVPLIRGVAWSVLPLVAGLFVLVGAVERTQAFGDLLAAFADLLRGSNVIAGAIAGSGVAFFSNLMNNLPAGLLAASVLTHTHAPAQVVDAMLIGVDLGPNLSITGSLATILWLIAIRRDGAEVGFWRFLQIGMIAMPPALALALAARLAM